MPSFNKVILIGNLTRDPELRFLPNGTAVAQVGIAVNRKWTSESGENKEEVTFVDVTLWGKTAENTAQYMQKGSSVMVEGRLQLDSWVDKNTNEKKTKLKVVGESVLFLSGGKDSDDAPKTERTQRRQEPVVPDNAPPADSDDVPF